MIVLNSSTNNGGSVIQTIAGHTYIDSSGYSTGTITFTTIINIGNILPVQKIIIGSATSNTTIAGTATLANMAVNGIGGTTVATTVKFKSFVKYQIGFLLEEAHQPYQLFRQK